MQVQRIIKELKRKYPNKNIVQNKDKRGRVTEIVCEVIQEPDYSFAIAVIDYSRPHYHKKLTETYKVIKGTLVVKRQYKEYLLKPGGTVTLKPYEVHSNKGDETWVEVISHPGWNSKDHILVEEK
jgi:mannose-6-phosphate isomerase-like protein (cupin superfamily)